MSDQTVITDDRVLVGGQPLEPAFTVTGIDVTRAVNRIPTATISIQAPGSLLDQPALMAGGPFKPAAEVEIRLGPVKGTKVSVFKGVVTALAAVHRHDGVPTLEVTIKDKAIRLAGVRHSRIWNNTADSSTADSDAIRAIVAAADLHFGDSPDTQPAHKPLVQYDATDWDFIVSRADAQGLGVVVSDGTLSLKKLAVDGATVPGFPLGRDVITDIHFELDAATQAASMSGLVWNPRELTAASPADADVLPLQQGTIANDPLSMGQALLTHMVPLPAAEAKAWAASRMARARLALIRGRISVPGIPAAQLMQVAPLGGFGILFNGKALVTGVRHRVDGRGFSTDLQFGLPPEPVGHLPDIADMQAGGLLPPISGLQLGTVVKNTGDPDKQDRVQVSVPAILTDPPAPLWARVASPDAGNLRGFCFVPEVGDEVLVGFLAGDPRYPVVLGRLHGNKNVLPEGFKDTKQKGIVAKSNARIVFKEPDEPDEKPSVTVSTPGGCTVVLDDKGGTITFSDNHGNTITLNEEGITIASGKGLSLNATGAVKVTGTSIDLN